MRLHGNILLLAACQALLLTNGITLIAVTGLVGIQLAPVKSLATLPLTAYVIGSAATTMFASLLMRRHGRRAGFVVGGLFGVLGSLVCALSVWLGHFWMLNAGTALLGVYNAFGQYYRFAAADIAGPDMKSRAISWTLAGGIIGGVLGPETSTLTRDLLQPRFAASYLVLGAFALLALLLVSRVNLPAVSGEERGASGRPLSQIARQPVFITAVIGALVGYGVMNLLMSATPIAMDLCRHPYGDTAFVLEWHVIAMFAPSFFTGALIARFGTLRVMAAGCAAMFACAAIALSGVTLMQFWWALVALGVGWNFLYIGSTTLLTECYTPAEKAKTQGLNDFMVFVTMALSSFASGAMVSNNGWSALIVISLPFLIACASVLLWLARVRGRATAGTR